MLKGVLIEEMTERKQRFADRIAWNERVHQALASNLWIHYAVLFQLLSMLTEWPRRVYPLSIWLVCFCPLIKLVKSCFLLTHDIVSVDGHFHYFEWIRGLIISISWLDLYTSSSIWLSRFFSATSLLKKLDSFPIWISFYLHQINLEK